MPANLHLNPSREFIAPMAAGTKGSEYHKRCRKFEPMKRLQAETPAELDALLPALLYRAFKGEL